MADPGVALYDVRECFYSSLEHPHSPRCLHSFACLVFVGIVLSPELPRHYLERGNLDQARINLGRLRGLPVGNPDLEVEILQMKRDVEATAAMPPVTIFDVWFPLPLLPPPRACWLTRPCTCRPGARRTVSTFAQPSVSVSRLDNRSVTFSPDSLYYC